MLNLLPVLVAAVLGPAGPQALPFRVHDLATLTDGEPDGDEDRGWTYDCPGEGAAQRTLWLPDGDDWAAYAASRGSELLVEATLRRVAHRAVSGADGSSLPALVEYRLTGARVVDRPER